MTYEITGGDNGNYRITKGNDARPVAFVRRNQTGGGYTIRDAAGTKSVQMRNLPAVDNSADQAAQIMAALDLAE